MINPILDTVVIAALVVGTYWDTLPYGLVMDDFQWWARMRRDGFSRFRLDRWVWFKAWFEDRFYGGTTFSLDTWVERCVTLTLHTLTCVLMYWVLGRSEVSFWAAMLYGCNPVNNQTSIWMNGRRYSLNIVLVLVMMAFPVSSLVLYPLTGMLQVSAFFSPVLLAGNSLLYLALIPLGLALGWKVIRVKVVGRSSVMSEGDLKSFKWTRLIVVVKTFGFFFWKMIFPQVCAMQYPDRIKWGLTEEGNRDAYKIDKHFWKGVLALGANMALVLVLPASQRVWAVFMFLAILQWSAVLPVTQILSDRYCSLPNVFMMFLLSSLLHVTGVFYAPLTGCFLLYYALCLSVVKPMYKDLSSWYQYHFQYFPGLSWYRHNLVSDLMNEGNLEGARFHTVEGLRLDPNDYRLIMWGAILCARNGDLDGAEELLDRASKNLYLGKEEEQLADIESVRSKLVKMRSTLAKADRMTIRERQAFMRIRGRPGL